MGQLFSWVKAVVKGYTGPTLPLPPPPSNQLIHCMCSDGVVVDVPANYMRHSSKLIDGMLSTLENNAMEEVEVPVGNIDSVLMRRIADWCEKHAGQPHPVVEEDPITLERKHFTFTRYERDFLEVSVDELKKILMAANFLDIPSLYLYACQRSAIDMMSKTVEQVRHDWGFPDDLTAEEKRRLRYDFGLNNEEDDQQ